MTPTPVYPAGIATDANLKVAANLVQTTLTVAVGASDTVLFVSSAAGFTANGLVSIDNEIIAIQSVQSSPNQILTVASGGRGFDGTTPAAHSAGASVSMLIDAWHHNALAAEVKAIEAFLGPNGQNLSASPSMIEACNFNFAPQFPGGSLGAGSNVITLTPVPPGVNGSDSSHYLYIDQGTGTAEAVLITGGTAMAGGASGTVIVNCANAHSGAWRISSATGGIQEALNTVTSIGTIVTLSCSPTLHAAVSFNKVPAPVIFDGHGNSVTRAADYPNGNLFSLINTPAGATHTIRSLTMNNNAGTGTVTGAAIYMQSTQNATVIHGSLVTRDVTVNGGQYGIRVLNMGVSLYDTNVMMFEPNFKSVAGISLEGPFVSGVTMPSSNTILSNVTVMSLQGSNANIVSSGLYINGVDGMMATNLTLQGDIALHFTNTNSTYNDLIQITNIFIDHARSGCIVFDSDSSGGNQHFISIHGGHVGGATNGHGIDIGYTTPAYNCFDIHISALDIELNSGHGIANNATEHVTIANNQILANNTSNAAGGAGIAVKTTGPGMVIQGNLCANQGIIGAGHQKYGISLESNFTGMITGNDLLGEVGNETAPLNAAVAGPVTGIIAQNRGVNDNMSQTLASASGITVGVYDFYAITGTTPIANIFGGWAGREITLQFTNAAPGGVTAGGNIYTAKAVSQNATVKLRQDASKWMVL